MPTDMATIFCVQRIRLRRRPDNPNTSMRSLKVATEVPTVAMVIATVASVAEGARVTTCEGMPHVTCAGRAPQLSVTEPTNPLRLFRFTIPFHVSPCFTVMSRALIVKLKSWVALKMITGFCDDVLSREFESP